MNDWVWIFETVHLFSLIGWALILEMTILSAISSSSILPTRVLHTTSLSHYQSLSNSFNRHGNLHKPISSFRIKAAKLPPGVCFSTHLTSLSILLMFLLWLFCFPLILCPFVFPYSTIDGRYIKQFKWVMGFLGANA